MSRERTRKDLWTALLVCVLCLLIYNANMRLIGAGDTYPARYLPFGIWRYHSLLLDPIATITAQGRRIGAPPGQKPPPDEWRFKAYWVQWSNHGHLISLYPVAIPVLLAPLYAPAMLYLHATGGGQSELDRVARVMEKLSASLIAAVSAALLYLLLRRRVERRLALLLTFAYAFGTSTWMIGSQALWQHGMTELLIVCMLLAVTGSRTTLTVVAAGFFAGLIVCNRPPDSILAAAIGIYGLWLAGRKAPLFIGSALAPVLLLMAYNLGIAGHWAGGYGLAGQKTFFDHDPVSGFLGLLLSPSRGLFVYSPLLLFVPVFAIRIWRDRSDRFLNLAMGIAILLEIAVYAKTDWRQGAVWGPRWLTSVLPMLIWMSVPVIRGIRRTGWVVFVAACLAGVAIQMIGAFWYTGASDALIYAPQIGRNTMRAAWDPRNSPFLTELRHPPAAAEWATEVRGSLDIARTSDRGALNGANRKDIDLEGWALASGRTPFAVILMLDGQIVGATGDFFLRPDVTRTLGVPFASGWRVRLPARTIEPGDHLLAVFVQAVEKGELFFLVDRKFTVAETVSFVEATRTYGPAARALSISAQQAAASIASHQQAPGYWLTAFTGVSSYRNPQPELNIFLNTVMVDLLAPIAAEAQLGDSMPRVRRFLSAQIEEGGLVRYHGRPDSSAMGTLGCAITPDADDTSLVWRVAPASNRRELAAALATLRKYRTPQGLYRTWLAPQNRYQCIDPGADPNPADIGIQMHIFMLLAKDDPPAARELCSALREQVGNDKIWVYYRTAPVIPILRQADMQKAGCPIELPSLFWKRVADGQEPWIAAARLLQRLISGGSTRPAPSEVTSLLETLSRDGFASLKTSPPLLYHNDLTASVPRFYWSEDMGYALWLRLYFENMRTERTNTAQ